MLKLETKKSDLYFNSIIYYLLSQCNVLPNVTLPGLKLAKKSEQEVEYDAIEHLKTLDMHDQVLKMPNQLTGG